MIENSGRWLQDVPLRDAPLRENAFRYRENNGAQILARQRTIAIDALRLDGIKSISEGIAALAHPIRELLMLLGWRPAAETPPG